MNKIPFLTILIFLPLLGFAQIFTEYEPSNFTGIFYGDCHWFDSNNDRKKDFIISGAEPGYSGFTSLYQNTGSEFIQNVEISFPKMIYSAIATADLDKNGFSDIIITGTITDENAGPVFLIYYNNGDGSYTVNADSGISPANFGSLQAADFNNDGLIDIFVNGQMGSNYVSKMYAQEENATFTEQPAGLMATYFSATKVFDANLDGLPDLLITGFSTNYIPETKLFLNQGNFEFTENNSDLQAVYFSSIDTADLNNDGYPDLLITGMNSAYAASTTIYTNDGNGNFTILEAELTGVYSGAARFADYDNDGLTDIFIMGVNANASNTAKFYRNEGNLVFAEDTETSESISGLNMSKAEFADYDNDGDMDLLIVGFSGTIGVTRIYTNNTNSPSNCSNPGENPGDLGCVTFIYQGIQRTYTTVRAADGNIWIQQNLGSEAVANSQTDEAAFGDLFQFGRWDDGHQLRISETNSPPNPNNPIGLNGGNPSFFSGSPEWWSNPAITDTWEANSPADATATNGCDPCKALGEQWSIPTQTEWQKIIADENINNIATAYESNLKLTVAGSRLGDDGDFNFTGQRGYYWSKTPSNNADFVKYLYYSNFIVNPDAGSARSQGLTVRCLYKTEPLATENFNTNKVGLYPNPTNGILNIQTTLDIKTTEIFAITGQLIATGTSKTIDFSGLNTGIYIVKIHFKNGQTTTQKVVRQ